MAHRDQIVSYLDDLLEVGAYRDMTPNGLQVPGADAVELVVTGVSPGLELIEAAAERGAQMVLTHHGLLGDFLPDHITPVLKRRLKALFDADLSLAAYHLPLDAHAEVGNNALICAELGLERGEPFGAYKGTTLGFVGRSRDGVPFGELRERCARAFGADPFVLGVRSRCGAQRRRGLRRGRVVARRGHGRRTGRVHDRRAGRAHHARGARGRHPLHRRVALRHRDVRRRAPRGAAGRPVRASATSSSISPTRSSQRIRSRSGRYRCRSNKQPAEERTSMANHLTPTELSRETGLDREEVIAKCVELGVPIFQGKIDKRCSPRPSSTTRRTERATAGLGARLI